MEGKKDKYGYPVTTLDRVKCAVGVHDVETRAVVDKEGREHDAMDNVDIYALPKGELHHECIKCGAKVKHTDKDKLMKKYWKKIDRAIENGGVS